MVVRLFIFNNNALTLKSALFYLSPFNIHRSPLFMIVYYEWLHNYDGFTRTEFLLDFDYECLVFLLKFFDSYFDGRLFVFGHVACFFYYAEIVWNAVVLIFSNSKNLFSLTSCRKPGTDIDSTKTEQNKTKQTYNHTIYSLKYLHSIHMVKCMIYTS